MYRFGVLYNYIRTVVNKTPFVMTRLYKTLVRPHVEYGRSAWSPWYVKDRALVEKVQRRFTKSYRVYRVWNITAELVNWACEHLKRPTSGRQKIA